MGKPTPMVARLLYLDPGQLRRAWPFFALYGLLFGALTLADGLTVALFVARAGAAALPASQAWSAACVMAVVAAYWRAAPRYGAERVFVAILCGPLLLFAAVWALLARGYGDPRWLGLLLVGREVAFALVLLHFGAYLQDFFTRAELARVMPVVYAGGRVGGLAGATALEWASRWVEPAQLLSCVALLFGVGVGCVWLLRRTARIQEPDELAIANSPESDVAARPTWGGFAILVWRSPLLFWITVSTVALFTCRAGLTMQYNLAFERAFADDAELARFLGRYTQSALAVSLAFQLVIVGRLVDWIGLRGATLLYALVIVSACLAGVGEMPLAGAVFARFAEGELRLALRNPVAQMTLNLFPKSLRTQARAWSLGLLIPAATLAAWVGLDLLVRCQALYWLASLTALAGGAYLVATVGLGTAIARTAAALPCRLASPGPRDAAARHKTQKAA